ncbi:cell growth regulator with RING finger domain protein 1 isoform X2 [Anolis sagrei]|uniref:cell growth regulator with RING finger domain protein 1 isoform X2 n=1 Tax=Anolis sagrei TaxID=38937 RepID=UPI00352151C3
MPGVSYSGKAHWNSQVFRLFLKTASVGACLMSLGREFQSRGATTEKALSLVPTRRACDAGGIVSRASPDDRREGVGSYMERRSRRFGWDVPVILRNSEETESSVKVSQKQMRQVKNPFSLEIKNLSVASTASGITLSLDCLEDCLLTCYWGCSVQRLHEALQIHAYRFRIKTPQAFEDALHNEYHYREQYYIKKMDKEEKHCQLPAEAQVVDFGPVPRSSYPLVALLTLADEDNREIYDIVSLVSVIHVPDDYYRLSCRMLYQYLLLAQGQFHDLKQLFMSANSNAAAPLSNPPSGLEAEDRVLLEKVGLVEDESETPEENSKDCIVCQNRAVNWVLLPCRHTCLCNECVRHFQQCPMCRQFVRESFPLSSQEE